VPITDIGTVNIFAELSAKEGTSAHQARSGPVLRTPDRHDLPPQNLGGEAVTNSPISLNPELDLVAFRPTTQEGNANA
jgi:hypothetical protein